MGIGVSVKSLLGCLLQVVKSRSIIAAAFCFAATGAWAQTLPCHPHDVVQAGLASKYGETRHAIGLASPTQIMEVWASDKTGTWSITVTDPAGITCMIGAGQGYEALTEPLQVPGAPT